MVCFHIHGKKARRNGLVVLMSRLGELNILIFLNYLFVLINELVTF